MEGVSRRDESMLTGRTRQGKLVHFAATGPGMAGTPVAGCVARVTITAGHPHHLSGVLGAVDGARRGIGSASRWPARDRRRPGRGDGIGEVGSRSGRGAAARATPRSSRWTPCACIEGWTSGTSKPTPAEQAQVPHHLIDLVDPESEYTVSEFQLAAAIGPGRHRGAGPARLAGGGDRAVPAGGRGRPAHSGPLSRCRRWPWSAELDDGVIDVAGLARPAGPAGSGGGGAHGADQPAPDRPRPRGHDRLGPTLLLLRARAWRRIRPRRSR